MAATPPESLDRPRERLAALGPEALSADELVAVVLGTGTAGESALEMARRLLLDSKGLSSLSRRRAEELSSIPGLGPARATRLVAAFALGRLALAARAGPRPVVCGPADVDELMRPHVGGLEHESFWVLALSVKNEVVDRLEVGRGGLTGVDVHPREVFRFLIGARAAAAALVHNHPSGDPTPSQEDVELTERLLVAGQLLGIPVVDHVVIGTGGYRSILAIE